MALGMYLWHRHRVKVLRGRDLDKFNRALEEREDCSPFCCECCDWCDGCGVNEACPDCHAQWL